MEKSPLTHGSLTEHSSGSGAVTRKRLRERAAALAAIAGRSEHEISKADWEQAKRESAGAPDSNAKADRLELAPEAERWDPVPGSAGHQAQESPSDDEDDGEGHNQSAQLVEEGAGEAGRNPTLPSARTGDDRERHQP